MKMLFTIIIILGIAFLGGNSCNDDDDDSNGFEFRHSCLDISSQLCDNYYGEVGGDQSDCEDHGGTYSTNKCLAENSLGVCTIDYGTLGYSETVYYNNQPPDVYPEDECALMGGTWSNTYNP